MLAFRAAFTRIRREIVAHPNILQFDLQLEAFLSPHREMSLLPNFMGEKDFMRWPHVEKLRELCHRYDAYHDLLLALEFIWENHVLYDDLVALSPDRRQRKLLRYHKDMNEVRQVLKRIQAGVDRYRNTHVEEYLEVDYYYPISVPPNSPPNFQKLGLEGVC